MLKGLFSGVNPNSFEMSIDPLWKIANFSTVDRDLFLLGGSCSKNYPRFVGWKNRSKLGTIKCPVLFRFSEARLVGNCGSVSQVHGCFRK